MKKAQVVSESIDLQSGSGGLPDAVGSVTEPKKSFYWTTVEVAALKKACSGGPTTWDEVAKLLPGRSETAAYQKAIDIGEKPGWVREKRQRSEELDKRLKEALEGGGTKGAIKKISEELGLPGWFVSRRAGELGLQRPRLKERDWSADELAIVDEHGADGAGAVHRQLKLAGYERTLGSVCAMLTKRKVERLSEASMSARGVAELMGVDSGTVMRWIEHKGLKGTRLQGGWSITRKAMKRWVLENPDSFDIKKVKQVWFMSLISGQ